MKFVALTVLALMACVISYIGALLVLRNASALALIDNPNARSSHAKPVATGGGIAIVLCVALAGFLLPAFADLTVGLVVILVASGLIATVGLVDDRRPVAAGIRLIIQLLLATCVVAALAYDFDFPHGATSAIILLGCVICLVASLNFFNFMDGIDGIAGSEALFIGASGAWLLAGQGQWDLVMLLLVISGSAAGFLILNWAPARIFMGDVGSGFLGFLLAAIAILATLRTNLPPSTWVILGGVFLVDATSTLFRRMVNGEAWWSAHRSHTYQQLATLTGSHSVVVSIYAAINVFWLLPAALLVMKNPGLRWIILIAALLPLYIACYILHRNGYRHKNIH